MRKFSLFILLVLLVMSMRIGGDPKPKIGVTFAVEERLWRIKFGNDVGWIESEGRQQMIAVLEKYFGFLDFSEEPDIFKLKITMKDLDQTTPFPCLMKEVIIQMSLTGPDMPETMEPLFWTFRSPEIYDLPLGEKEGFLKQVMMSFEAYVQENRDIIVTNLFSKVRVANEAYLVREKLYWIIPLECSHLRVGYDSEFLIITEIEDEYGHIPKKYYTRLIGITKEEVPDLPPLYWGGKIISIAFEPIEEIGNMQCGSEIGVWIQKYIPGPLSTISASSPDKLDVKDEE